jgi:oxygen-independent coproporphyrinogen III oxidase
METSLYVHIPFCKHRCHYCDFNTYTGKENLLPVYIDALIREFRIVKNYFSNISLTSVYFGGGTPSLVSISSYQKLISEIEHYFSLGPDCEISLEANPGTITSTYLSELRRLGFNRISIGAQSTNSFDLVCLDRIHNINDILDAVRWSRMAGFANINLDMIFNLPWQDLKSWENSLARAIELSPDHFSLYALIIETGTPFSTWYQSGLIAPQNQDLEADMFELAIDRLAQAGYSHYEISNWAKTDNTTDLRSRHNLQYWLNLPYIGVGAGAHGYIGDVRTENVSGISEYVTRMNTINKNTMVFPETPATIHTSQVEKYTQMQDFMWLGLRLVNEGVSEDRFQQAYDRSMREIFKTEIAELIHLGLVAWDDNSDATLKLTRRGLMLANQVFMRFV